MGPPDQGVEYTSIDVDALGEAVDDLDSTLTGLTDHISGLERDFQYFGVDTSNLNKLLEAKTDLEDLMPDMRRRHSLAVQLLAEHQSNGWSADGVISFQGTDILNDLFDSVEDAQQAGQDLADQINDGDGEIPEEVWEELAKYGHDPDFAEAFVNGLDPASRGFLISEPYRGEVNEEAEQALSTVFSTASFRIDYDTEFISEMNEALLDAGLHPDGIRLVEKMAGLMDAGGTWNPDAIVNMTEMAMDGDQDEVGWVGHEARVQLFEVMGKNPRAAAEYMHKNPDDVWELATLAGPLTSTPGWDEAFAKFVTAGTVDAHSIYERLRLYDDEQANLAEENAVTWITNVGTQDEPWEFSEEMSSTFSKITEQYWDDFMHAFSSPAGVPPLEDGESPAINGIDPGVWDAFITEGMYSEEGAARTFELFQNQVQDIRNGRTGDNNASGWDGYIAGRLSDMFLVKWNEVLEKRGADAEEAKEFRDGVIDWLIDTAFDPKGAVEDIKDKPKEIAKEILGGLVKGWMDDLNQEETQQLDTDYFGYHQRWRDYANGRLQNDEIEPYDDGTVTWDGDPGFYEEMYGGDFTDGHGNLKDFAEIQADPDALAAYNAWLQDPAVQRATNPFFQDEAGPN